VWRAAVVVRLRVQRRWVGPGMLTARVAGRCHRGIELTFDY
jgi:hypothetical protein